jgi:hypothetical protein
MQISESLLMSIEAVVNGGKAVVSADNSIIVAMMQEALTHGRSATFYVSPAQAQAVMRLFCPPGESKKSGMSRYRRKKGQDGVRARGEGHGTMVL